MILKKTKIVLSLLILLNSSNLFSYGLDDTYSYLETRKKLILGYSDKDYFIPKEVFYAKVMNFYNEMKDVKYKFGGTTMDGIDCSAFIRKFYKDEFNVDLPRSTHTQVYEGMPIEKHELALGDLIFFKEKKRISNHVGIYIGKGRIIHSSSTNKGIGVDYLSKFDNIYWTSRRVLDIRN